MLSVKAEFAVGRAAERDDAARPGGLDGVRADARAHRAVLGRIVRLPGAGTRTGSSPTSAPASPTEDNVHEVAQREAPESRLVYVDRDPIVLALANQLRGAPPGTTTYIYGELSSARILPRASGSRSRTPGFSPAGSVGRVVEASGEVAEDLRCIFRSG